MNREKEEEIAREKDQYTKNHKGGGKEPRRRSNDVVVDSIEGNPYRHRE